MMIKGGTDAPSDQQQIIVVENWFEQLKARVATP